MNSEYEVQFDTKVRVDPVVRKRAGESTFLPFINLALPSQEKIVREQLRLTPAFLEVDLSTGYRPYVASQHILNTRHGPIEVGIISEMVRCEGKQSIWHTTVTTTAELKKQIVVKQDLTN